MGILESRVALVTGATSGMGRACAERFASEGAYVILVGRNIERGKAIEKKIIDKGGKAEFIQCDLSAEQNISTLAQIIEDQYQRLDILFSNAGEWITRSLEEIDSQIVEKTFSTNFYASLYLTKYLLPMLQKSKGNILFNSSMGGLESYTNGKKQFLYHTSKAALIKFAKLCAKNYAPDVRVNCICPGLIETEIFENRDFSRFDGQIPLGYLGKTEDVANVALFLVSDAASYLTGVILPVDGGASLT